jgi:hypothetical protein
MKNIFRSTNKDALNISVILSREITDLHLCSFCGHYLDMPLEEDTNEQDENSGY